MSWIKGDTLYCAKQFIDTQGNPSIFDASGGPTGYLRHNGALDAATATTPTALADTINSIAVAGSYSFAIAVPTTLYAAGDVVQPVALYVIGGNAYEISLADPLVLEIARQSGDSYAIVNSGTYGNSALHTGIAAIPTNPYTGAPPTTAQIATAIFTDLMSGSDFATTGSFGALVKSDINSPIGSIPAAPSTSAIAAAILANPAHLLATDVSGNVTLTPAEHALVSGTDVPAAIAAAALATSAQAAAIKTQTDKLLFDGSGYVESHPKATDFAPPTAAAVATAVLTDTADNSTPGSLGFVVSQNLDAKVSGRAAAFTSVVLAASQPNYAPAKAGDAMDLVAAPNSTAIAAIQAGLALASADIPVTADAVAAVSSAAVFSGSSALSASDLAYPNMTVVFTSGANAGLARKVTAYAGSTRQITVDTAFPASPNVADTFDILGYSA